MCEIPDYTGAKLHVILPAKKKNELKLNDQLTNVFR